MYVSYITQLNWKLEDTNLFERPGKLNAYGIYFRIIRKISWGNRFNKQIAKSLMTRIIYSIRKIRPAMINHQLLSAIQRTSKSLY